MLRDEHRPSVRRPGAMLVTALTAMVATSTVFSSADAPAADAWADEMSAPYVVFGGSSDDVGESIAIAPDGAIALSGRFNSATIAAGATLLTNLGTSTSDIVVMSLSPDGTVRWARSIASTNNDQSNAIDVDAAGNVYVAGQVNRSASNGVAVTISALTGVTDSVAPTFSVDSYTGFVAKFGPQGALSWITTVDGPAIEAVSAIDVWSPGTVLIGGFSDSATTTVSAGSGAPMLLSGAAGGGEDGFVAALDVEGRPMWTTRIGGSGNDRIGGVVAPSPAGSIFVTGKWIGDATVSAASSTASIPVHSGGGGADGGVVALGGDGAPDTSTTWSQRFGGTADEQVEAAAFDGSTLRVAATIGGPGVIGGSTNYASASALSPGADILLARFDTSLGFTPGATNPTVVGTVNSSEPRSIAVTPDGGDVTVGFHDMANPMGQRFSIVRRNAAGAVEWIRTIGGTGRSIGQDVAVDAAGNLYMTGRFAGGDVDPSPTATTSVTTAGSSDIVLLRLDCRGELGPACLVPPLVPPPPPPPGTSVAMLPTPAAMAPTGSVDSAVAISQTFFAGGAATVHIVTSATTADGIAAAPAAAAAGGPLLLTDHDTIPAATMAELRRLAPTRIVIVGGTAAISDAVESALAAIGAQVERVGGRDRYATAAEMARRLAPSTASTVYIATGDGGADALVAAAAAGRAAVPVLMVQRDSVPSFTAAELARLAPQRVVVVGGPAAITDDVISAIRASAPGASVVRAAGPDRHATSAELSRLVFTGPVATAILVVGSDVAGALGAPPAAVSGDGPVMYTRTDCIAAAVHSELMRLRPGRIVVIGDTAPSVLALTPCDA